MRVSLGDKVRVIHGGPTTGKTTLVGRLRDAGVTVFDTDDLIRELYPEWFDNQLYRTATQVEHDALDKLIAEALGKRMTDDGAAVAVTNLWGPVFRRGLGKVLPNGRIPVSFWVVDAEEISRRAKERGDTGIPLRLAQKWTSTWKEHSGKAFDRVVTLPKSAYLSTVLEWKGYKPGNAPESKPVGPAPVAEGSTPVETAPAASAVESLPQDAV